MSCSSVEDGRWVDELNCTHKVLAELPNRIRCEFVGVYESVWVCAFVVVVRLR